MRSPHHNKYLLLLLTCGIGCRSIESTFFDRDPATNQLASNKLDGYPITLKVPTHIRVTLYLNNFLEQNPAKKDQEGGGWRIIHVAGKPLSAVSFSSQLIETEKIFTLDHKRPVAGQIKYGVNFTEDQYVDEFSEAATEDAIRQSGIALSRTISILQGGTPAPRTDADRTRTLATAGVTFNSIFSPPNTNTTIKPRLAPVEGFVGVTDPQNPPGTPVSTVIATDLFEIDDPEFELKVSSFLRKYNCGG